MRASPKPQIFLEAASEKLSLACPFRAENQILARHGNL